MLIDQFELWLSIVLALGTIFVVVGFWYFFLRKGPGKKQWQLKLEKKLKELDLKDIPAQYQVIELDKLLESAFNLKYSQKLSLGKSLKKYQKKFTRSELNEIWSAHKLRNKLVHDHEFEPTTSELNHAKIILRRFINDLIEN